MPVIPSDQDRDPRLQDFPRFRPDPLRPMLIVSFGSPSMTFYAVTSIVRQIMDTCLDGHSTFNVTNLEDLGEEWSADAAKERTAALVVSDCPHPDVVELFVTRQGPILVAADPFHLIVHYVIRTRKMEFAPAVRFATQAVCALNAIARAPHILRITPEHYKQDLAGFIATICAFAGVRCSDAHLQATMAALSAGGAVSRETLRQYIKRRFPESNDLAEEQIMSMAERQALGELSKHYGPLAETGDFDEAVWPTSLFFDWERPGTLLNRAIDLLGPARCIIYGPYLHLPPGRWRVLVDFETTDCLSDNKLGADVFSGRILSVATLTLPVRGRYGFHLDFEVLDPMSPLEMRVHLLTGAIEGTFRLIGVRLARTAPVKAEPYPPSSRISE